MKCERKNVSVRGGGKKEREREREREKERERGGRREIGKERKGDRDRDREQGSKREIELEKERERKREGGMFYHIMFPLEPLDCSKCSHNASVVDYRPQTCQKYNHIDMVLVQHGSPFTTECLNRCYGEIDHQCPPPNKGIPSSLTMEPKINRSAKGQLAQRDLKSVLLSGRNTHTLNSYSPTLRGDD